ncbi:polyketide cyclase/dehydrase/lipid transport protein [Haloactinopolyspora alba]|uniref:Polyketide cyclase/dehydrase/lipid transport protein n=1 Tax=Haloactinopolyspora alba TaxID=648780 RepID=A0A2P8E559_9ACTN|nr:SRPBCC family protein [Haloactinopolyspora alba]PSL04614.1 polyketide cyclase/dehydrase/lipid transport protein [Haloactinopolyspora alba]
MAVIRNSVVIRCTPAEAFDYLSDLRSEHEWNPDCQMVEKLTEGPIGVGTTYRAKWRHGGPPIEPEVVAYDRPHMWRTHNGGPLEVTFTGRVEGVAEGTLLSIEFAPRPHGWFRLAFPLFLVSIRRAEKNHMRHIREALERRSQSPSRT